ncbi:DUF6049 family protein [Pseudactinotalea suaedae]|uniref:DUF6049 family protein n=1 Tax=Pseudactinotalea suaedae TaxID=1524924 RepID=UPI0012E2070A|nr:DUF6049 family protein [Pseudactinotalea suaedae]
MTLSTGAHPGPLGPWAPSRRRAPRALLAMLAAVLGIGIALWPLAPARADDGDLVVELISLTPAVVTTGDTLVISGRIRNTTDEELAPPAVRLLLQKHVPSSTQALASWLDGTNNLNVSALTGWNAAEDAPPLPPNGVAPFTIEIATDGTFSELSAWGPRGIQIEARADEATGSTRTTMLWYPDDPPVRTPSELTLLVPLTPTAREWQEAVAQRLPVGEVAAPRLLTVLEAVGTDASLAIDPALLESEPPAAVPASAGEDETADESPDETSGTEDGTPPDTEVEGSALEALLEALTAAERRGDLIALGYADADVTTLVGAGGAELWEDGVARSEALLAEAGLTVENVAWPPGPLSQDTLSVLMGSGSEAVVLDAADFAVGTSTHATATSGSRQLDALLADDELGDALASTELDGVAARQATLALSAVLTRALSQEPAGLLVVMPRDLGERDLGHVSDQVQALDDAPWFETATLRSLLGRTGTGVTLDLPTEVPALDAIEPSAVDRLLEGRAVVEAYTEVAGPTIHEAYLPALLTPLSATLDGDAPLREQLLDAAVTATDELGSMISVETGSDVLLISGDASLPVTLSNQLPVEAQVVVELVPEGSRLQVRQPEVVVLPPQQSTTARIPITAVANGNVMVDVHVRPAAGERDLAEPASFAVRVRAEWENIGTGVVAGLLAVAFVIGLIRTIRRGGRRARAQ